MRGNPVIRFVLLVLFLAGAGLLVGRIAKPTPRTDESGAALRTTGDSNDPAEQADFLVEAFAEIQFSAPAKRISLGQIGSHEVAFDVVPDGLECETEFQLALRNGTPLKDILVVEWAHPDQSNFLHLTIEPDTLKTQERTLHFPPGEDTTILDLHWTPSNSPAAEH